MGKEENKECCGGHEDCGCSHSDQDMEKQKLLQSKYMEYQVLEQQLKQIQEHMQKMEEQVGETVAVVQSLEELNGKEPGSEVLVPISNGIFFKAKKGDVDKFLVNVGSGIVVEKDFKSTKELIDARAIEIEKYREQLSGEMVKIIEKYQKIEKELEQLVQD